MTKADFIDWKSNPITKQLLNDLQDRIRNLQAELGVQAGLDPRLDALKVGAIQAYTDLLDLDFDEETQE